MTIFSQYGEIMDVHNVKDRETGKFRCAPLYRVALPLQMPVRGRLLLGDWPVHERWAYGRRAPLPPVPLLVHATLCLLQHRGLCLLSRAS